MFIHAFAAKAECLGHSSIVSLIPLHGVPKIMKLPGTCSAFFRSVRYAVNRDACFFFFLDPHMFFGPGRFFFWAQKMWGDVPVCFLDPVKIFFLDLHVFVLDPGKFY